MCIIHSVRVSGGVLTSGDTTFSLEVWWAGLRYFLGCIGLEGVSLVSPGGVCVCVCVRVCVRACMCNVR